MGQTSGGRRFAVGEHTALFTYSADVGLDLVGVEINGEYARSARYSRYPAQREREAIYLEGSSFSGARFGLFRQCDPLVGAGTSGEWSSSR